MNKKDKSVKLAVDFLLAQIDDKALEPKDRQMAAKAVLSYYKESVRTERYEKRTDTPQKNAVEAAERLRRVK